MNFVFEFEKFQSTGGTDPSTKQQTAIKTGKPPAPFIHSKHGTSPKPQSKKPGSKPQSKKPGKTTRAGIFPLKHTRRKSGSVKSLPQEKKSDDSSYVGGGTYTVLIVVVVLVLLLTVICGVVARMRRRRRLAKMNPKPKAGSKQKISRITTSNSNLSHYKPESTELEEKPRKKRHSELRTSVAAVGKKIARIRPSMGRGRFPNKEELPSPDRENSVEKNPIKRSVLVAKEEGGSELLVANENSTVPVYNSPQLGFPVKEANANANADDPYGLNVLNKVKSEPFVVNASGEEGKSSGDAKNFGTRRDPVRSIRII
ncbi:unnamed protein product [Haemonchus placei]|uniref:Uncharacterized protein n=1 Tax=Haemonchus placei TaxID=6290 RepID=A0A0N4W2R9_HAEPC|nr:unnamed protein product [Haemonchus placei]